MLNLVLVVLCSIVTSSSSSTVPSPTAVLNNVLPARTVDEVIKELETDKSLLLKLESQMTSLRNELGDVMKRDRQNSDVKTEMEQMRTETENLRSQLETMKHEVWNLKEQRDKDQDLLAKIKINEATNRWSKNVIEEIRRDLVEISSNENVSLSLNNRQRIETEISLIRSDLKSLISNHNELKVNDERGNAQIVQLKLDNDQLREDNRRLTNQCQLYSAKVTQLENDISDLKLTTRYIDDKLKMKIVEEDSSKASAKNHGTDKTQINHSNEGHLRHHHGHMRHELTQLSLFVKSLDQKQKNINGKVDTLEQNLTRRGDRQLEELMKLASDVQHDRKVSDISDKLGNLDKLVEEVRHQASKHALGIRNLTEVTGSVYNLHDSTMQLFKSLEGIDAELTKNIEEIHVELSKVAYNVGRGNGAIEIIKKDQKNDGKLLQEFRNDLSTVKSQMSKDRNKLTSVQNEVLQNSLQKCKDRNNDLTQNLKISRNENRISSLHTLFTSVKHDSDVMKVQMKHKASDSSIDIWKKAYQGLHGKVQRAQNDLDNLNYHYDRLDKEMTKMVYQLPNDCTMKMKNPLDAYTSGVYLIRPVGISEVVEAYCDFDEDGRWTVVQRRTDGREDFYRDWQEYKHGFGNKDGEYWLGNEALHHLTDQANYTLRMELWDNSGNYTHADYDKFYVGDESDKYRLYIDGYHGNASDSMSYHNKQSFSTKDSDNDASSTHCAVYYSAGWWFTHCQYVNVNGKYDIGLTWYNVDTHKWTKLSKVVMKIKQN